MVTAGTVSVFGETITNPTEMVARVGNLGLTVIAAFAFFAATIGINMVANFVPPAYDLANLMPSKIDFRTGGLITSIVGFVIGALWVSFISQVGMFPFVNTLGAILAPVYGIMIVDYYVIKNKRLDVNQLFSSKKGSKYYYNDGWNQKSFCCLGNSWCVLSTNRMASCIIRFRWICMDNWCSFRNCITSYDVRPKKSRR